jgi:NADPH2:quinone reductase
MKAVVVDRWGDPDEVLQVREVPAPAPPQSGQVRVRMLLSPINPSDVLTIQGRYGRQPALPAVPGFEGVGIVVEGRGLLARRVLGRRVAVLNGVSGNWQEQVVVPARQAVPVPAGLSDEQAAMFFVNPASALAMIRHVHRVPRGAWLLQTAAGSALGRMIIRLGVLDGFRTLNIVRRKDQANELLGLGATAVVATDTESLSERVQALTESQGVLYAVDAVGGAVGSEAVGQLGRGGRLLVYGALSGQPLTLDPRTLLVGQKRVEGFWLSEWVRDQNLLTMLFLLRRLGKMIGSGVLASESGTTFPIDAVREAMRLASTPGRKGKVLLRLGER